MSIHPQKFIRKIRKTLTLIEMLIVIALIGIIGSALAYNMSSGLSKGKEFRNEQNKRKIRNMLDYEIFTNGQNPSEVAKDWLSYIQRSTLRDRDQTVEQLTQDGYGSVYHVTYDEHLDQIVVLSSKDQGY